jgi:hypothetical protein
MNRINESLRESEKKRTVNSGQKRRQNINFDRIWRQTD